VCFLAAAGFGRTAGFSSPESVPLESGRFDKGNANGTNLILSRAARKQTSLGMVIMFSEGD
jgi:hypothetical protein